MKTEIYVAYHKPATLLKSDVFVPMHVGCDSVHMNKDFECGKEWLRYNCVGDNTGDNLSYKNPYYCELTMMYWVWKNANLQSIVDGYVGFMHYRRHLAFANKNGMKPDKYGCIHYKEINAEYIDNFGLDDKVVEECVRQYDIVTAKGWSVKNAGSLNLMDHYANSSPYLHEKDILIAMDVIKNKYPNYYKIAVDVLKQDVGHFTNIFIMKNKIFEEYAEWLFNILFEVEKRLDTSLYNVQESRVYGYISEWLFTIWCEAKRRSGYRIGELERTFVDETNVRELETVNPCFETNDVNICLATDGNYVDILQVALTSIVANSSCKRKYDIVILATDLKLGQKEEICNVSHEANISIRVLEIDYDFNRYFGESVFESGHITKGTYYRLLIPQLFKKYNKVLYLDSDLVVTKDVSELFDFDIDGYCVGGVLDYELVRWYCSDEEVRKYIDAKLGLERVTDYFNSGVTLFNIDKINLEFAPDAAKKAINVHFNGCPKFHDQDVNNYLYRGRVKYLDPRWNCEYHIPIWSPNWRNQMPLLLLNDYEKSRKNPFIIHYAGGIKPWQRIGIEMGDFFWKYARMSTVYEKLLILILPEKKEIITKEIITKVVENFSNKDRHWRLSYYKYKVLGVIVPWHAEHYRKKAKLLKYKNKR